MRLEVEAALVRGDRPEIDVSELDVARFTTGPAPTPEKHIV